MTIARTKLVGWIILFVAVGAALQAGVFGPTTFLGAIVGLVLMLGLLAFTVADWRLMDEASRAAHTTAAFWGMGVGATLWGIAMVGLIYVLGPDYGSAGNSEGSLAMFALGGLAALGAQLTCYLAGVALWWLTKR